MLRCVYRIVSAEAICVLAGIPTINIVADEGERISVLHVGLVWGVKKLCRSDVMKGKLHSINGKNGSLEARKENGPVC